jgi:hypothetical protein
MMGFRQFQRAVGFWVRQCFGEEVAKDKMERAYRFLEESNELAQSLGVTKEEAHSLVDYTWGREIGEPAQEVGGVMVTLAALCEATDMDIARQSVNELDRVGTPEMVNRIREKQKSKPHRSPLPGEATARAAAVQFDALREQYHANRAINCTCLRDHFEPRCDKCPDNKPAVAAKPVCLTCNGRRTIPSLVVGYVQDCPTCCGEEG